MSLTCTLRVILNNIPQQKSDAIRRALEPDNVDFPENFVGKMHREVQSFHFGAS